MEKDLARLESKVGRIEKDLTTALTHLSERLTVLEGFAGFLREQVSIPPRPENVIQSRTIIETRPAGSWIVGRVSNQGVLGLIDRRGLTRTSSSLRSNEWEELLEDINALPSEHEKSYALDVVGPFLPSTLST
jgi:hypothetical protein